MRMLLISTAVTILAILAGYGGFKFTSFMINSVEKLTEPFGKDTIANINSGDYFLACSDATALALFFTSDDFRVATLLKEGPSEDDAASQFVFYSFDKLMQRLNVTSAKNSLPGFTDEELAEIEAGLKEDVSVILEAVYVTMAGDATLDELDDYIEQEFCPASDEPHTETMQMN